MKATETLIYTNTATNQSVSISFLSNLIPTVFDEDVSANQDVVVEMKGAVDGIERTGAIITQVGTAPTLPETMDVIYPDGI